MIQQAAILAFLGRTQDRFSEYHSQRSTQEKLELLSRIPGMSGFEIVFPYETGDPVRTTGWARDLGLGFAAINVNIKKDTRLVSGSLTRSDSALRRTAIELIKGAKDYAQAVGAPLVTCCPLADGYDYLFQVDYAAAWANAREALSEAAAYLPQIPLCVEYKFSETRVRCTIDSAAKALLLCREIGNPSLGVTLDFGHSLYGNENPSEALCLLTQSGFPYYIHLNDNDARFDWDCIGGTYHPIHYAEFLFWAREYGYAGYFTSDMSPRVLDIEGSFALHAEITARIWESIESLDRSAVRDLMMEGNTVELQRMMQSILAATHKS